MFTVEDINTKNDKEVNLPIKLTKQRWTILFLFVLSSALNNMQWMQYSVIADVIVKHYDVSHEAVNWTSMVFLLFYGLFILPGNYILEKFGIRKSVLLSSLLNCIGCWIKIFSVGQDKFWLVIIGQSVVALATMCVVSAPAVIAAEWFGSDEVALACSISLNGIMLGIAAGILTSSLTVSSGSVEHDLFIMLLIIALITTSVLVVQLIFFSDKPKNPPSKAQLEQLARKKSSNFLRSTLRVFKNVRYLAHLIAFGINYGISCSFAVLLNQMLSNYYINASVEVGRIGAIIIFSGIFGSILCGIVLDKFKQYKVTYIILQSGCIVSMLLFTYNLGNSLTIVYLISAMFGFFTIGLQPVGFETAIEFTYPESEVIVVGFLYGISQLCGLPITYIYSQLLYSYGDIWGNNCISIAFSAVLLLICCIPFKYNRYAVNDSKR